MAIDKDASYYDAGGIEAKLGPELFAGFLLGNCLKYTSRLLHKGRRCVTRRSSKRMRDQHLTKQ